MPGFRCRQHRPLTIQKLWQVAKSDRGVNAGRPIEGPHLGQQIPGGWVKESRKLDPGLYCYLCLQDGATKPLAEYDQDDIADAHWDDYPLISLTAADFSVDNVWPIFHKEFHKAIVAQRDRSASPAVTDPILRTEKRLDPAFRKILHEKVLHGGDFWTHQATSIRALLDGRDVVIETATASGKSLCFWVPILNSVVQNPNSSAIYISPMNALSEDQIRSVEMFGSEAPVFADPGTFPALSRTLTIGGKSVRIARYDSSVQGEARSWIRAFEPNVLITNPDMLHLGIVAHHDLWTRLFHNLNYIVLDELHMYKGMFGAHTANVIRRVLRLAAIFGQRPKIVACSASIGNPVELFEWITSRRDPVLIPAGSNGAPLGRQRRAIVDVAAMQQTLPTVVKDLTVTSVAKVKARTIVFMRSISEVGQVFRYVSGDVRREIPGASKTTVREYKKEILAQDKARMTADLKSGATVGVISTTALQLGIDIGDLSVCIVGKFPGSRAAFFQQSGRVGRKGDSIVLFVADESPLDQYYVRRPTELFDAQPEVVFVSPYHHDTVLAHLRLAAEEHPLDTKIDKEFWPQIESYVAELSKNPDMKPDGREVLIVRRGQAAQEVKIRSLGFECKVKDESGIDVATPDVIRAVRFFHKYARFQIQEHSYEVTRLSINWDNRHAEATARRLNKLDYSTSSVMKAECQVLAVDERRQLKSGSTLDRGSVRFRETVDGYYKLAASGATKPEYQALGLAAPPYRELDTKGLWFSLKSSVLQGIRAEDYVPSVKSACESLRIAAALMCSIDPDDLDSYVDANDPSHLRMYLSDNAAGGNGLTEQVFKRPAELLDGALRVLIECPHCKSRPASRGCPSCVTVAWGGDEQICRDGGIKVLKVLRSEVP